MTDSLARIARQKRDKAYAPYSGFAIGAAARLGDGDVISACNIDTVTMRGLEATHGLIAALISKRGQEIPSPALPITEVVFSVTRFDAAGQSHLPGPEARGLLTLFAAPGCRVHIVDDRGAVQSYAVRDLLPLAPGLPGAVPKLCARFAKAVQSAQHPQDGSPFTQADWDALITARINAFNPKTGFSVGATVKTEAGGSYTGCNVEFGLNAALHAEQSAVLQMVAAEGQSARIKDVLVMVDGKTPWIACPVCINTLAEFRSDATTITAIAEDGAYFTKKMTDIYTAGGFEGYRVKNGGGLTPGA
jgi:cytidine deaminase